MNGYLSKKAGCDQAVAARFHAHLLSDICYAERWLFALYDSSETVA